MNSGFGDFQDLINTTTSGQAIDDVRADLVALEETVDGNTADIASNLVTIQQNTYFGLTNRMMIEYNGENIAGNSQGIASQSGLISTNTNNIASNLGLINNNASNITQNGNLINDNSTLISDLFTDVSDNEQKIISNEQKIISNDGDIFALQTDRLKSDGSIQLDFGYTPYNNQDIATKTYVDDSTVSDATKLNKSNGVVDNNLYINNTSNSLTVTGTNLEYTAASEHHWKVGTTDVAQFTANYVVLLKNVGILGTLNGIYPNELDNISGSTSNVQGQIDGEISRATAAEETNADHILDRLRLDGAVAMFGDLNMGGHSINNIDSLNLDSKIIIDNSSQGQNYIQFAGNSSSAIENRIGYQLNFGGGLEIWGSGLSGSRNVRIRDRLNVDNVNGATSTEISYLSGVTSNIQGQIAGNANAINANDNAITATDAKVATNTGNIALNAANITTNNTVANSKVSKAGDTMTGSLQFNVGNYIIMGANAPKSILFHAGEIEYYVHSATQHMLIITGGISSTSQTAPLTHMVGKVEITDSVRANAGLSVHGSYGNMNRGSSHGGTRQIRLYNTFDDRASWAMGNQYDEPDSGDNDLYFEVTYTNGAAHQAGYIQDSATNVRMNFTGQHRCQPMFEFNNDMVGLIVESTGSYMNLITEGEECSQISCITINDSLPMVRLCNEEKSKKVFGVISAEEQKTRTFMAGNFVSLYDKVDGDRRIFINGVGEGGIWVCNKNGNLENGDYITSSGINGYGMKQDSEFLANYTVAKITMDCDFNPQMEEVKRWEDDGWEMIGEFKPQYEMIELDDGMRVAFVGCSYHCS